MDLGTAPRGTRYAAGLGASCEPSNHRQAPLSPGGPLFAPAGEQKAMRGDAPVVQYPAHTEEAVPAIIKPDQTLRGGVGHQHCLSLAQVPDQAALVQRDGRVRSHRPIQFQQQWVQGLRPLALQFPQPLQRHHLLLAEGPSLQAAQGAHMAAAAQALADILNQSADVGAFRAAHLQFHALLLQGKQPQFSDDDPARRPLYLKPLARQLVEALPLVLKRRVHGRDLLDLATEVRQRPLYIGTPQPGNGALGDELAVAVAGGGSLTQPASDPVQLIRRQQEAGHLGGFAEADRQHAGSHHVQTAGMPGFAGTVNGLDYLQGVVGSKADRLVQRQNAMHVPAAVHWRGDCLPPSLYRYPPWRMRVRTISRGPYGVHRNIWRRQPLRNRREAKRISYSAIPSFFPSLPLGGGEAAVAISVSAGGKEAPLCPPPARLRAPPSSCRLPLQGGVMGKMRGKRNIYREPLFLPAIA